MVRSQANAITLSTDGAYTFHVSSQNSVIAQPKSKLAPDNTRSCYASGQLQGIQHEHRAKIGRSAISIDLVFANEYVGCDNETKEASWGGVAVQSADSPTVLFSLANMHSGTVAHEMGHLLDELHESGLGLGLGHQPELTCRVVSQDGEVVQRGAVGSIQSLVNKGCAYRTYENGEIDPYASWQSIMARGSLDWFEKSNGPILSPPRTSFYLAEQRVARDRKFSW